MLNARHIFVARAASSVRFAPEDVIVINEVPSGAHRATVIVRTRYSEEGFTKPLPRELWIEARGSMPSFDQAIVDLTNAPQMILPAIAFCVNAPVDDPELELALEVSDDSEYPFAKEVGQNNMPNWARSEYRNHG